MCPSGLQVRRSPNLLGALPLAGIGSLACHMHVVAVSGERSARGTLTYFTG